MVVVSESTAAVEVERRIRALVTPGSRAKAFKVEVNARVAGLIVGPDGSRLQELEELTKRRFFFVGIEDVHLDHMRVLEQGTVEKLAPDAPVEIGEELELKLGEVGLHDAARRRREGQGLRDRRRRGGQARRQEGEGPDRRRHGRRRLRGLVGSEGASAADHRRGRGREAHPRAADTRRPSRPTRPRRESRAEEAEEVEEAEDAERPARRAPRREERRRRGRRRGRGGAEAESGREAGAAAVAPKPAAVEAAADGGGSTEAARRARAEADEPRRRARAAPRKRTRRGTRGGAAASGSPPRPRPEANGDG